MSPNKFDISEHLPKFITAKNGKHKFKLSIAAENMKVIIAKFKPKHKNYYAFKEIVVPKDHILPWYSWKCGGNQSTKKNNGIRFVHLLLPKFLLADNLTMNAIGLLQAEMTKSDGLSSVIFTNSEPNLVNTIFEFFQRFGISKSLWRWDITFNFKLLRNETEEEKSVRESQSLNFWLSKCGLDISKSHYKIFYYTGNRNYVNMKNDTVRTGS